MSKLINVNINKKEALKLFKENKSPERAVFANIKGELSTESDRECLPTKSSLNYNFPVIVGYDGKPMFQLEQKVNDSFDILADDWESHTVTVIFNLV